MSLTTNGDDNKNVFVCCGVFSITSPLLCPVLLATHVIWSEIIVGANADPMALMRTGATGRLSCLLEDLKGDTTSSEDPVPGY